jgi:CRP-like cAMP-binding protein
MANARFDSVLAKKLSTFIRLSADELKWLARLQTNPITIKRGRQLTQEGESGHKAFVLQAGWACSFKLLASGSRQIISFPIAGDIVGRARFRSQQRLLSELRAALDQNDQRPATCARSY